MSCGPPLNTSAKPVARCSTRSSSSSNGATASPRCQTVSPAASTSTIASSPTPVFLRTTKTVPVPGSNSKRSLSPKDCVVKSPLDGHPWKLANVGIPGAVLSSVPSSAQNVKRDSSCTKKPSDPTCTRCGKTNSPGPWPGRPMLRTGSPSRSQTLSALMYGSRTKIRPSSVARRYGIHEKSASPSSASPILNSGPVTQVSVSSGTGDRRHPPHPNTTTAAQTLQRRLHAAACPDVDDARILSCIIPTIVSSLASILSSRPAMSPWPTLWDAGGRARDRGARIL